MKLKPNKNISTRISSKIQKNRKNDSLDEHFLEQRNKKYKITSIYFDQLFWLDFFCFGNCFILQLCTIEKKGRNASKRPFERKLQNECLTFGPM